ncbi:hypothetical protein DSM104299_03821 [Baekduia alba]|uniref:hypothetical protein n=1 Tax=Baekduia alba TaxID=2997333 RepID=UPI0023404CEB|nr:hypothetical protein [Baekduia alba]WCB95079.1 hypothetical protein DSM104299_03821 [Baekduia alba]
MASKAIRATVGGDVVQATFARAGALGVLGWVRVAEDDPGATAMHVEGEAEAVDTLVSGLGGDVEVAIAKVEGHEQLAIRGVSAGPFAVLELGDGAYELRLDVDGSPRAWRLRKAPSMDPADKRGATGAEPVDAGDDTPTWDHGTYEQGGRVAWPEAIDRGHAVFVLHGARLQGGFALQRTRGPQWLLIKRRDAYAVRSTPK